MDHVETSAAESRNNFDHLDTGVLDFGTADLYKSNETPPSDQEQGQIFLPPGPPGAQPKNPQSWP